ncbi:hypothetical protein [Pseudomonas sp. Gutcm_11s]|uniref:hypothetical protein n=1 Tax=Pseudomonas sp. Gutcm_11s TaxID=3026088 RepID=UPI002362F4F5|nr:hypothetical protein [Pseudomonas sp. Gutcm_11s]MDD0843652.1 hypothetical protein [Pseudomonas sp. Gutcm_11s]
MKARIIAGAALLAGLSGCMSNQEFIAANQDAAVKAAVARGSFELDCKDVTPSVLTSKVVALRFGYERTEYTIGIAGCGKRTVYLTYCLDPETCNAIGDSNRIHDQ